MLLPFKVKPQVFKPTVQVGSPEDGILEFPQYGSFTIAEEMHFQELTKDIPKFQVEVGRAAQAIAYKENITAALAYKKVLIFDKKEEDLTETEKDERETYQLKYASEIDNVVKIINDSTKARQIAAVTVIMPRLAEPLKQTLEQLKTDGGKVDEINLLTQQIEVLSNWSLDNTKELEINLFRHIAKFAEDEMYGRNGNTSSDTKQIEAAPDLTDEEVGKLPAEPVPQAIASIGETSTGESNTTGQMTTDSTPTTSPTNQPG